jgi:hypothetical protein
MRDMVNRINEIKRFNIPVGKSITLMWNTHPDVVQTITDAMGPVEMDRRRREAENELTGRRLGGRFLWTTSNKRGWGALHFTTFGRKSGQERCVIIGYLDDGPNLVASR